MKSDSIEHAETLTLAIQSVLRRAGLEIDYATIGTVLGISFVTCASDRQRRPRAWATACRDLQLLRQSALFGVRLRDLHPPEASLGLDEVNEFALHFQDSYVPLIRRALDAGQCVLAWQGWPHPYGGAWGVISAAAGGAYKLSGTVDGCGEMAELVSPPIQCYVVEQVEPRRPDASALAAAAVEAAATAVGSAAAGTAGWVIGPAAYDVWIDVVRDDIGGRSWSSLAADHAWLAASLAANRRTAARFFGAIGTEDALDVRPLVRRCEDVADVLESMASGPNPTSVIDLLGQAQVADAALGKAALDSLRQISAIK